MKSFNDEVEQAKPDLYGLVSQAAPVMALLAHKGGSLFAKQWLDAAKEYGIEAVIQTPDLPDDGA